MQLTTYNVKKLSRRGSLLGMIPKTGVYIDTHTVYVGSSLGITPKFLSGRQLTRYFSKNAVYEGNLMMGKLTLMPRMID